MPFRMCKVVGPFAVSWIWSVSAGEEAYYSCIFGHRPEADGRPHAGQHFGCEIGVTGDIDLMIRPDRDRDRAVLIGAWSGPGDRVSDPGQAKFAGAQKRVLPVDSPDLPAIACAQALEFRPEIGAGDTSRRGRHLDDVERGLS